MTPDEREAVLAELRTLREALDEQATTTRRLYALRLDVLRRGRELDPPITQKELADAAGVSEPAVIGQLRQSREPA